jgi:hypothetical protein
MTENWNSRLSQLVIEELDRRQIPHTNENVMQIKRMFIAAARQMKEAQHKREEADPWHTSTSCK